MATVKKWKLDLSTFDNRLLDGLNFCRKVYALFDQIRLGADGIANLRLRPTKQEKRLIEELIPLARYVQSRYREGRRIKVRWLSGSQSYDAVLFSYSIDTVLIVYCVLNGVTLEDEWDEAVRRVDQANAHHAFKEVFLVDTGSASYSATLYGAPNHAPNRRQQV